MSFDKNLRRFSRALPPTQPPAELRDRVLGRIPAARATAPLGRYIAAGIIVATASAGIFIMPRLLVKPSFAQEMRSAVEAARTWHFVGWRLKDGKQVRWEIWGQRSPYFYREQIGDDIQIEQGNRRIRLIPPDPNPVISRKTGFAILMPSAPLPTKAEPNKGNDLLPFTRGIGGDYWNALWFSEESRTPDGKVTLRSNTLARGSTAVNTFLTADAGTKLPVRIEIQNVVYKAGFGDQVRDRPVERQFQEAALEAEYNAPLPDDIAAQPIPPEYRRIDFTQGPSEGSRPDGSTTRNGLTIKAEALAQDATGNLRLRFRAMLGSEPLDANKLPLALGIVHEQFDGNPMDMLPSGNGTKFVRKQFATDNRGNHYGFVSNPPVLSYPDAPEMYLVPIEPFAPDAPRPTQISVRVDVSPQFDAVGEDGQIRRIPITQEKMEVVIPLPRTVAPDGLGYDTASSPQVITSGKRSSLALLAADARVRYYADWQRFGLTPQLPRGEVTRDMKRAIYWMEVGAKEAERLGIERLATEHRAHIKSLQRDLGEYQQTAK